MATCFTTVDGASKRMLCMKLFVKKSQHSCSSQILQSQYDCHKVEVKIEKFS